jgi:hypothetical protein
MGLRVYGFFSPYPYAKRGLEGEAPAIVRAGRKYFNGESMVQINEVVETDRITVQETATLRQEQAQWVSRIARHRC